MDKKTQGSISAIIAMITLVVYFLVYYLTGFQHSWLVFMIGGVAIAIFNIIANMKSK